ncbi:MAG: hypothetical protein WCP34_09120 [Pseudomonadota bacterium]
MSAFDTLLNSKIDTIEHLAYSYANKLSGLEAPVVSYEITRIKNQLQEFIASAPESARAGMQDKLDAAMRYRIASTMMGQAQTNAGSLASPNMATSDPNDVEDSINIFKSLMKGDAGRDKMRTIIGRMTNNGRSLPDVNQPWFNMAMQVANMAVPKDSGNATGLASRAGGFNLAQAVSTSINHATGASPALPSATPSRGEVVTIHLVKDGVTQSVVVPRPEKGQAIQFFNSLAQDKRSSS